MSELTVTTNGRVFMDGKELRQYDTKGYRTVSIDRKLVYVHRLVAERYIPNPENKPEVNHIDANKANNDVSNLEWVTRKENAAHAAKKGLLGSISKKRLKSNPVYVQIRIELCRNHMRLTDLCRLTGIKPEVLYMRFRNGNNFKRSEIISISKVLDLSEERMICIFMNQKEV
jgi:hypothetical protein